MTDEADTPEDNAAQVKQSPLHDRHLAAGAKFSEFGGWSMPLEYPTGVVKEHNAVRAAVGIFDVSHLGKAMVSGPGAAAFINRTLSNDLAKIAPGQAQYTLCLDPQTGGIVDDLIAYLQDDDHVLLVPNAANSAEVLGRLSAELPDGVVIADHHEKYAVIAVQGPKSDETLQALGLPIDHDYMSFVETEFDGVGVVLCRTGYTGERGYELIIHSDSAGALWDALLEAGADHDIVRCGLGARDTLRTEMGYPLHGQDLSPSVNPLEGRVGWAVGWKKPDFWGSAAVKAAKEAGVARTLRGLLATGRGIPRPGMAVSIDEGEVVGEVTSGTFSPTLRKGIALAMLPKSIDDGAEVGVDIRGRREVFTVVKPPFVDTSVREN